MDKAIDKKDFRLTLVAVLQKIVGYTIFLFLVFCFWQYREMFSMVNIYRVISYFDMDISSESGAFLGYSFEVGVDSMTEPYGNGLAVLSKEGLKLINAAGVEDLSVQIKLNNPALSLAGRRILVYDKGGKNYSIIGSYSLLKSEETPHNILWGEINANGSYMLITDEAGYKGVVTIYSSSAKEQYKWLTSEYYTIMGCINEKGNQFVVYCIGGSGETPQSIIRGYALNKDEPIFDIDVAGRTLYSLEYNQQGQLTAIFDDGLCVYDAAGRLVSQTAYTSGDLQCFLNTDNQSPLVALSAGGGKSTILLYDNKESNRVTFETDTAIRSLSQGYGIITALSDEYLYTYHIQSKELTKTAVSNSRGASVRPDGNILMIYGDKAEILQE